MATQSFRPQFSSVNHILPLHTKTNGSLPPIYLHPTPQIIPTLSCGHLEESARYSC